MDKRKEYLKSLQDQGLERDKIRELMKIYDKENPVEKETEVEEEVVENDNSEQVEEVVAEETTDDGEVETEEVVEEKPEDDSEEYVFSETTKSMFPNLFPPKKTSLFSDDFLKTGSILGRLPKQKTKEELEQEELVKKYTAKAKPGETYVRDDSSDKTEYKYEVEDGKGVYYYRNPGSDKWLTHKPGSEAEFAIATVFGHAEGDLDELYRRRKQREAYKAYTESDQYNDFVDYTASLKQLKNEVGDQTADVIAPALITADNLMTNLKLAQQGIDPDEAAKKLKYNNQLLINIGEKEFTLADLDAAIFEEVAANNLDEVDNYAGYTNMKFNDKFDIGADMRDGVDIVTEVLNTGSGRIRGFGFLSSPENTYITNDGNRVKVDNFNKDDFFGYLRKTGLGDEFVNNLFDPDDIYGTATYIDKDSESGTNFQKLGAQRDQRKLLNSYLNQKTQDYNTQLQLNWIKKNPEAVKDAKSLEEAKKLAKDHFRATYGTDMIPLFDMNQIDEMYANLFPELKQAEELNALRVLEQKKERIQEDGFSGTLNTLSEAWDSSKAAVWNKIENQSMALGDLFGLDTGAWRMVANEQKIQDSSLQNNYFYAKGTVGKSGEYTYVIDHAGTIYNTDLGLVENSLTEEEREQIKKDLDENGKPGSDYNFRGGVTEGAAVASGLVYDIANLVGSGKVVKGATKLLPSKIALRMNPQTFAQFGYYGFQGYASAKSDVYQQLLDANISREEAEQLSEEAGQISGIWMAGTSMFAPNTAYVNNMMRGFGFNSIFNKAVNAYKNGGRPAFTTSIMTNFKSKFGNIAKNGASRISGGFGEVAQELSQDVGTQVGVNSFVNFRLGSDVLNTDYTFQDMWRTSLLSFGAGSALGGQSTGTFGSTPNKLQNLFYVGSNYNNVKNMLNLSIANNDISKADADRLLFESKSWYNNSNKLPVDTDPEIALDSTILMQEISDLETRLKKTDPAFQDPIKEQIADKKAELSDLAQSQRTAGVESVVEQLGGTDVFRVRDTADLLGSIETLKGEGIEVDVKTDDNGEILDAADQNYGLIATLEDGTKQVIINSASSDADGELDAGGHEVFHLFASKIDPAKKVQMGQDLYDALLNDKNIKVDAETLSLIKEYKKDLDSGKLSEDGFYEEVMAVTSDGLASNKIQPKEVGFLQNIFNKILETAGWKQSFKDGNQVIDFLKSYNKDLLGGKGLSKETLAAADVDLDTEVDQEADLEVLDEVVITAKASKNVGKGINDLATGVTKAEWDGGKADEVIGDLFENNTLKGLIESKIPPVDQQPPGFNADDFVSGVFTELIPHIRNFNPEVNDSLSGWINSQLGNKIGNVFKSGDAGTKDVFETDVTAASDVAADSAPIELDEVVVTAKKKSPKADSIYGAVMAENLGGDVATEIDNAIQTDLKTANITDFGSTRNVGPALASVLGKGFGINPQVFSDKSRNIQKKDLAGLTNLRQYLTNNAQSDFSNLPDAYNIKGKSTFIPNSILEALYIKDGKGKWKLDPSKTVADYKALIGEINTDKPIYRSKDATIARALGLLSFRNKIFETAFPTADLRVGTGVKFSQKPPAKSDKGVQADARAVIEEVVGVPAIKQDIEGTSTVKRDITTSIAPAFGPLAPVFITATNLSAAGNSLSRALKGGFAFITDPSKTQRKDRAETNKAIKDGLIGSVTSLVSDLESQGIKLSDAMKDDVRALKAAIASQKGPKKVRENQQNVNTIKAGKKIFYDAFKASIKADPAVLRTWQFIFSNQNANAGAAKNLATLNNDANGPYEEHWFPAGQYGLNLMKAAGISLSKNDGFSTLDNYIKFANKNYYQERIPVAVQKVVDKSYDIEVDGEIVKWKSENQLHPLLEAALNKALDTNTPEAWAEVDKLADIRKYPGKDVHTEVNPFVHGNNGKTDAEKYGIKVPVELQGNPNIQHATSAFIHDLIVGKVVGGKPLTSADINARLKAYEPIAQDEVKSSKKNNNTFGDKVDPNSTIDEQIDNLGNYDKAAAIGRELDKETKGISVFDFDDTLAKTKEKVIVNLPNGKTKEISASEFAKRASELEAAGATFDFSNFENVAKGTAKGPLADLALRRQDKFGSKDIFVLTARPQSSATAIQSFLDGIGLNIPLENITGLADGTPGAKGRWIASKAAEGYNDFYFADDSLPNVKAVSEILDQIDVKSDVQIALQSKKKNFDKIFNDILESSTGIESFKEYSKAKAVTVGKKKGRFSFFTTPSAEDFLGLLYKTLGKGKVGDAQIEFYKKNLIDPYDRAEIATTRAKVQAAADFKKLKGSLTSLPTSLSKEMGYGGFTHSQAARVAVWTRQGMEVPGLSKTDLKALNDFVDKNPEMNTLVDELMKIQKGKPYPAPDASWLAGSITTDVLNGITKVNRKEYLQEWQENVDIIFSDKNMNKLEAAYGPKYVEALRDQLRRMKSGSNRPIGGSRVVNNVLDWLNNSVGAIMFLNTRSAVLQTLSAVNFIGVGNNSLINSAKAFANQKQYWKDFKTLMNSPYLVERRNGLRINVSESEIADAVAESSDKPKAALNYLLNKGFVLTRFADSFAIATGGAGFYRNQLEMYIKQGMPQDLAQKQAFEDFYSIAEKNQQSSNPSKISQQQASGAGRVILAFANTPMQYARIIKRSTQDLINGRGDWKKHVGTIAFYGVAQNLIFNAMQNALFADAFGEDEEDEEKSNKTGRIANGMADSLLAGLGIQGKGALALKNSLITLAKENDKKSPKFVKAVYDLFDFSPPLDSKFRKLRTAANTFTWDRQLMKEKGFSLDNPAYLAGAQVISGLTNVPLDRAIQKMNNIRGIMSEQSQNWQKVALALGWSTWDVGLGYYGGFDKPEPLTEQEQFDLDVTNMKKETTAKQQKETLLELGLSKAEIKKLKYEEDRVKKIIELQNKKKKDE